MTAKTMAEVIREELRKGSYQMPGETLPYETQANAVAAALSAAGFGLVADAKAEALLTMADRLEKARDMTWNGSMRKVNGWASAADFIRQHAEEVAAS